MENIEGSEDMGERKCASEGTSGEGGGQTIPVVARRDVLITSIDVHLQ